MKFLGYILTVIYATFALSPLFPFVEYVVKYDYIISEKCENKDKPEMHCNGKCHLKKQVENTTPTKNVPQEAESFYYYEFLQLSNETALVDFMMVDKKQDYNEAVVPGTLDGFERAMLQPPRG